MSAKPLSITITVTGGPHNTLEEVMARLKNYTKYEMLKEIERNGYPLQGITHQFGIEIAVTRNF